MAVGEGLQRRGGGKREERGAEGQRIPYCEDRSQGKRRPPERRLMRVDPSRCHDNSRNLVAGTVSVKGAFPVWVSP